MVMSVFLLDADVNNMIWGKLCHVTLHPVSSFSNFPQKIRILCHPKTESNWVKSAGCVIAFSKLHLFMNEKTEEKELKKKGCHISLCILLHLNRLNACKTEEVTSGYTDMKRVWGSFARLNIFLTWLASFQQHHLTYSELKWNLTIRFWTSYKFLSQERLHCSSSCPALLI